MSYKKATCAVGCVLLLLKGLVFVGFIYLIYLFVNWSFPSIENKFNIYKFENSEQFINNKVDMAFELENFASTYDNSTTARKDSIKTIVKIKYQYWDIANSPEHVQEFLIKVREGKK